VTPRRVVFVIFDGFQSLDLVGPYEVFQHASELTGGYRCEIVAPAAGAVTSGSALPVHAGAGVAAADPAGVDTLVVAGGGGVDTARHDPGLVGWVAAAGASARRVTSVCSGVFLLAAAGLVTGRRVTTHWAREAQLRREHPDLQVDCDPIFIRDTAEVGSPPTAYVERVRVEAAQRALAAGGDPVEAIARRCGFGTAESLRRAFHRHARVAPSDYRDRFRSAMEVA
jgi:transcriptional regulator GlxA family with amidase domain